MSLPLGSMDALVKPEVHTSVDIDDSCNNCCAGACFRGRKVTRVDPRKILRPETIDVSAAGIKITSTAKPNVSSPHLNPDGQWEVEIDGQRVSSSDIAVTRNFAELNTVKK